MIQKGFSHGIYLLYPKRHLIKVSFYFVFTYQGEQAYIRVGDELDHSSSILILVRTPHTLRASIVLDALFFVEQDGHLMFGTCKHRGSNDH
jgi:hypothetical protein